MAGYSRTDRLSEQVKHEVYSIIHQLKDPRIPQMVSVTYASVTPDLHYAKIGVSSLGGQDEGEQMLKALKGAAGFIRRELGTRMDLRYVPELSFVLDNSIERSIRIQKTLSQIAQKEQNQDD